MSARSTPEFESRARGHLHLPACVDGATGFGDGQGLEIDGAVAAMDYGGGGPESGSDGDPGQAIG